MDGWVTIGTKLDTKQLEKDIKGAEKELQKYEKEGEKLTSQKLKIEADVEIKAQEFNRKIKEIEDKAKIDIQATGGSMRSRALKEQKIQETAQLKINSLQKQWVQYLDESDAKIANIAKREQEVLHQQGLLNNKITEMNQELEQSKRFNNIKDSIGNVSNSMSDVLKKVAKWSLAIFGVRSAYMMVRQAMSTLSQYNEQMATNIEYIRYAIANTLKPVIEWIINAVVTLLKYINYIARAWFGINLFASAKNFEKMKKSSSGVAKNAKEINKQLAGFDEMNILSDTSSNTGGAGGEKITAPDFDLGNWDDIDIPEWIKWIADNKDIVIAGLLGIAAGLTAVYLGATPLQGLGIGLAVTGIIHAIESLIKFLKNPTFDNFIGILEGIAIAVMGVAIAFGAWPIAIGAAVALIIVEIVKNFDKIIGLFDKLINWIDTDFLQGLRNLFGPLGDFIYIPIKYAIELAKGLFETFFGGIKKVVDGIVKIFQGDFLGGIKLIFGGLLDIMTAPLQGFLKAVKKVIPSVLELFKNIGTKVGDVIGSAFKTVINGVLKAIESILNSPIKAINGLIGVINKVPGINLGKLSTFNLPRLAVGGIINMPGRGVPVGIGQAIGGEAGAEGVIPLTNEQMMDQLGEAIARHMNIPITNIVKLDNRQIAREQKNINAQNDFAYNR